MPGLPVSDPRPWVGVFGKLPVLGDFIVRPGAGLHRSLARLARARADDCPGRTRRDLRAGLHAGAGLAVRPGCAARGRVSRDRGHGAERRCGRPLLSLTLAAIGAWAAEPWYDALEAHARLALEDDPLDGWLAGLAELPAPDTVDPEIDAVAFWGEGSPFVPPGALHLPTCHQVPTSIACCSSRCWRRHERRPHLPQRGAEPCRTRPRAQRGCVARAFRDRPLGGRGRPGRARPRRGCQCRHCHGTRPPPHPVDAPGHLRAVEAALAAAHAELQTLGDATGDLCASTVAVLVAYDHHFAVLWAGDSRVYRLRGGPLERLTRDHSLVQELIDQGRLAPPTPPSHPMRNRITRAVGLPARSSSTGRRASCRGRSVPAVQRRAHRSRRRGDDQPGSPPTARTRRCDPAQPALAPAARDNVTVFLVQPQDRENDRGRGRAAMELINATRFQAAYTMGTDPTAREHIVVAVKGTFAFPERDGESARSPTSRCRWSWPTSIGASPASRHRATRSTSRSGSPDATCCSTPPPTRRRAGRRPTSASASSSAPGRRLSTWSATASGSSAARRWDPAPEPFLALPITYERAFGGTDDTDPDHAAAYMPNPVGRGYGLVRSGERLIGRPAPNTEAPGDPVSAPWGGYRPMGLRRPGPECGRTAQHAGTYDQHWLDEVFPFLPADFDDRYYQAAPEDQWLEEPNGGEEVVLLQSHARRPHRVPAAAERPAGRVLPQGRQARGAPGDARHDPDRAGPAPRPADLARQHRRSGATCSSSRSAWSAACRAAGGGRASWARNTTPRLTHLVRARRREASRTLDRRPLTILACGMTTAVGLTAPASCAAIRARLDGFRETRFMARGGEWIIGSRSPAGGALARHCQAGPPAVRRPAARMPGGGRRVDRRRSRSSCASPSRTGRAACEGSTRPLRSKPARFWA